MRGGDWTETEIKRFLRRDAVFQEHGLGQDESESLAQRMLYRDRPDSGDNRRVCFECRHLNGTRCRVQPVPPHRVMLQRCDWFTLKGAK